MRRELFLLEEMIDAAEQAHILAAGQRHLHALDHRHADRGRRDPRVHFRAEEYTSQFALVAAGLGVGVLPRLGRPPLPDTVRVDH